MYKYALCWADRYALELAFALDFVELLSANEGDTGPSETPFYANIDESLRGDAAIPVADESEEVMTRILQGRLVNQRPVVVAHRPVYTDRDLVRPVRKVLIHARGCTAAKLIRIAQRQDIQVILVQSDPDMESAAVDQLTDNDTLVCIGGNTPDESYLNAQSVLNVAENQGADNSSRTSALWKTLALRNWFAPRH